MTVCEKTERSIVSSGPAQETGRQRPARLSDVAAMADVSVAVASHVLNESGGNSRASAVTIARIQKIASLVNYRPHAGARHMRGKRTFTYGVLVASAGDPLRSFLVQDLDLEAVKIGRQTIICNTVGNTQAGGDRFADEMVALAQRGVDGVFCAVHGWRPGDREELLRVHPNTVFYEDPGITGAAHVAPDRAQAARIAVSHLVERGRKRVALAEENMASPTGIQRLAGYKAELEAQGMPFDQNLVFDGKAPDWVCGHYDNTRGTWYFPEELADRAIEQLVVREEADAIVAHNDYWGAVFIRLLRARGLRVPEDVAIVGYLNHYLAECTDPPLTSISPCHEKEAEAMVAMLEKMISEKRLPENERQMLIEPRLIPRAST